MSLEELKLIQSRVIKKKKIANIVSFFIIIFYLLMFFYFNFVLNKFNFDSYLFYFSVFSIILGILIIKIIKKIVLFYFIKDDCNIFNRNFKEVFVLSSLKKVFNIISYDLKKGIDKEVILSTDMLHNGDIFDSNDHIIGTYKNNKFEYSDVFLMGNIEVEDKNGNVNKVMETIFLGKWIIFDINKKLSSNIYIYKNNYNYDGEFNVWWNNKYKKISLENGRFDNSFYVYSEKEDEVCEVLTISFLERIEKIFNEFNCEVRIGFIEDKLHIAISNDKSSFEQGIFKRINEAEIEKEIMKDIKFITDFIDELCLDNDLFKDGN